MLARVLVPFIGRRSLLFPMDGTVPNRSTVRIVRNVATRSARRQNVLNRETL